MAQWVTAFAAKPDDQSSTREPTVEREPVLLRPPGTGQHGYRHSTTTGFGRGMGRGVGRGGVKRGLGT